MAVAPVPAPPSTWNTIETDAGIAWDYYESPVTDVAGIIGLEVAWLTAFLVVLKALGTGLWMEFKKAEKK